MRRKVRSLSDLYRRIPKCASSSVLANPQSPSINISATQASTGTEVATTDGASHKESVDRENACSDACMGSSASSNPTK
ncbi:hypothetical protein MTR67_033948 [Solanum verrucosum]|uniref:Uncharacterized protein n=1 Tax=Solanum verrucosum TaxID=315347 RepID=A0AAF0ZJS8_SOLVR|nr:hypothetical protein MTR67_033948 [Solanum verrucosum]